MKMLRIFLLALFYSTQSFGVALNPVPLLQPLYKSYNAESNDNFYTVSEWEHQYSIWAHGYSGQPVVVYLEKKQQPNTKPFMRFYNHIPYSDHFYTTSDAERDIVLANGFTYEGIEGYIYEIRVPGTVALHRFARFDGYTGDLVHTYEIDEGGFLQWWLPYLGWQYDGVAGYVYQQPSPEIAGGAVIAFRCPTTNTQNCWSNSPPANYRDYFSKNLEVASTVKPAGTTKQVMTFNFWTPDYFSAGGHVLFGAHGVWNTSYLDLVLCPPGNTSNNNCIWHRGLGFILYGETPSQDSRCAFQQVCHEAWYWYGNGNSVIHAPATQLLQNNRNYQATLIVSDSGFTTLTIRDVYLNQTIVNSSWQAASVFPPESPFPSQLTGYFISTPHDSNRDFTFYVENLSVSWIP